jgi:hypothetical protein
MGNNEDAVWGEGHTKQYNGQFAPVRMSKVQRESVGMAPRILNLAVPPVKSSLSRGLGGQHSEAGLMENRRISYHCWQFNQESSGLVTTLTELVLAVTCWVLFTADVILVLPSPAEGLSH